MSEYFSMMPIEIFMDDRLSKTDIRVLGAIMSWRNKDTNLCYPSREQIAERCNLPLCKISTATTRLVEFGWLEKVGSGGRSMSCTYKFTPVEITVTKTVTVTKPVTVTKSVTVTELVTVTDSVKKTVTDSVRGKELKENLKKKIYKKEISENQNPENSKPENSSQTKNSTNNQCKSMHTFTDFLRQCKKDNKSPIPEDDSIFDYANDEIKIPLKYIELGWIHFKYLYLEHNPDKKHKDWRATFRDHVRRNFLKVWFIDNDGKHGLTTLGMQLERKVEHDNSGSINQARAGSTRMYSVPK